MANSNRDTLIVEDCELTHIARHPDEQYILKLHAPRIAERAAPGSFVHLTCEPSMAMRRPLSIMRASADDGWIEVLFKTVGAGTAALAARSIGDTLSAIGPIGNGFIPKDERPLRLLIGGGVGIPPVLFLSEVLNRAGSSPALVIMGSEVPFPFDLARTDSRLPGVPSDVNSTIAELEAQGIPTRLASLQGYGGCYNGYVTALAEHWLANLSADELTQVEIFACGPNPMLAATAKVAENFGIPAQVSLEEFMACAVGGCAGCTVRVSHGNEVAMKRVCVDGPVFDSASIDWAALASH